MAAGSSAPELATVVIGVFFAKDDIGVSIRELSVLAKNPHRANTCACN